MSSTRTPKRAPDSPEFYETPAWCVRRLLDVCPIPRGRLLEPCAGNGAIIRAVNGHPARKATWLYYVGVRRPRNLVWGPSQGLRLDEGFHSREERLAARAAGVAPRPRLSRRECVETPLAFRDVLLDLARNAV